MDYDTPAIISTSYGFCEASLGLGGMSLLNSTYQQAAAEGFSVFAAAGEYGQSGNLNCLSTHATTGNSCIFYDISYLNSPNDSTIVVPCKKNGSGTYIDCYRDGAIPGVLSTDNSTYAPAYAIASQSGWDFTTGIGSPNVTNLVNVWLIP